MIRAFAAAVVGGLAAAALLGLGLARDVATAPLAAATVAGVALPGLLASWWAAPWRRWEAFASVTALWSVAVLVALPVWFPGERRGAIGAGLGLLFGEGARALADRLPEEPDLGEPAPLDDGITPVSDDLPPLPPPPPLDDHQIALPFEGEGRRLSVPVALEHGGRVVEVELMLDTGATYTALSSEVLARLGALPGPDAPVLTLQTANGPRQAPVVLLDTVWLGDLTVDGVAVTLCDDCASDPHGGLLGLNVSGGFNLAIDADRREVVFSSRGEHDRALDVRPFVELDARVRAFPGGLVQVALTLDNPTGRALIEAAAEVSCDSGAWRVALDPPPARAATTVRRRLPSHPACEGYRVELVGVRW